MSEPLDLEEVILAELRHPGSALAARVVVTVVADRVVLAGCADSFLERDAAASPGKTVTGVDP